MISLTLTTQKYPLLVLCWQATITISYHSISTSYSYYKQCSDWACISTNDSNRKWQARERERERPPQSIIYLHVELWFLLLDLKCLTCHSVHYISWGLMNQKIIHSALCLLLLLTRANENIHLQLANTFHWWSLTNQIAILINALAVSQSNWMCWLLSTY